MRRPTLRRPPAGSDGVAARDLIGLGHVVLGAIGVANAGFALMWSIDDRSVLKLLVCGALLLFAGATVLAGLWIQDGQWRGACLAAVVDVARLVLLLVGLHLGLLELLLSVGLLGGAVWITPELWAARTGSAPRGSQA